MMAAQSSNSGIAASQQKISQRQSGPESLESRRNEGDKRSDVKPRDEEKPSKSKKAVNESKKASSSSNDSEYE